MRGRLAAVFALAAAISTAACAKKEEPGWFDPEPAPAVHGLAVTRGEPFELAKLRGKVVLLSFGYTSCADVCPATFATVKSVYADLHATTDDLAFVYVTVDPERDRPAAFKTFVASVDPRFEGVYADGEDLRATLAGYHVGVRKRLPDPTRYAKKDEDPSAYYAMDHTTGIWGIDRAGQLRFRLSHDVPSSDVREATRRLLEERREPSR